MRLIGQGFCGAVKGCSVAATADKQRLKRIDPVNVGRQRGKGCVVGSSYVCRVDRLQLSACCENPAAGC